MKFFISNAYKTIRVKWKSKSLDSKIINNYKNI